MNEKYYLSLLFSALILLFMLTSTLLAADIPNSIFSINNAQIGATALDEIQKIYGINVLYRVSKEDEADVEVCYFHNSSAG